MISILLVFVFMAITAVQIVHKHKSVCFDKSDTEYVFSSEKCSICDYFVQKQSNHATLSYPPVIVPPITNPFTLLGKSFAGNYKFTLQGFTNKGPPASIS